MRYYTGVGSRKTPGAIFDLMGEIGRNLAIDGYVLRSGGASGADTAFEQGCDLHEGMKEIYLPWKGFSGIQGGRDCRGLCVQPVRSIQLRQGWCPIYQL